VSIDPLVFNLVRAISGGVPPWPATTILPVDCTPAQLALAWLLHRHQDVIPIPGTSNMARLEENIRAADVQLSEEDLDRIENVLPKGSVMGERYAPAMMKIING